MRTGFAKWMGRIALVVLTACSGGGGGGTVALIGADDPEIRPGGTDPEVSCIGLRQVIPEDGGAYLRWTRVTDPVGTGRQARTGVTYRVYLATLPDLFDYGNPALEVADREWGRLTGLRNGLVYWVHLRAWEGATEVAANRVVLSFMPAPVRYLVPGSTAPGRDGLSPATAFATLREALDAGLPQPATVRIGEGEVGAGITLPGDVSLVGGFAPGFEPAARDPWVRETRLTAAAGPLLGVYGSGYTLLSGLLVDGANRVGIGLRGEGTRLACRNCSFVRVSGSAVSLVGDTASERRLTADLAHLRLLGNLGRGLEVTGLTEVRVHRSLVRNNRSDGVAARTLSVNPEGELLFHLDRCTVTGNGGVGVEIGLAPGTVVSGLGPGRVTAQLRGCLIRDNLREGVRAVADLHAGARVRGGIQVTACDLIGNGAAGILVQPSLYSSILVHGNRVSANRGSAGITVSPGTGGSVRVCNNAVYGNTRDGIRVLTAGPGRVVMIHNNDVAANGATGLDVSAPDTACLANTLVWNATDSALPWQSWTLQGQGTGGHGVVGGNPAYATFPVGLQFTSAPGTRNLAQVPWSGVTSPGEFVEIGDDGLARRVTGVNATGIFFDPPLAAAPALGTAVFVALTEAGIIEDLRPGSGSGALGKGSPLLLAPRRTVADTGFTGGPLAVARAGVAAAGVLGPLDFLEMTLDPPAGTSYEVIDRFTLVADRALDPATVTTATVRLYQAASMASIALRVNVFGAGQDRFVVSGFPALTGPVVLVVTTGLKAADGTPFSLPLIAYFHK